MRYHYNCTCGYSATYETDRAAPETLSCNRCKTQVTRKAEKIKEMGIEATVTEEVKEVTEQPKKRRGRPRKQ
jgi:hypothetical protein